MKIALKIFAILTALIICFCSCGTSTVTSEISFDDDTGSYEDFDESSEVQNTSSEKKKTSSKKSTASKAKTSSKKTPVSSKKETSGDSENMKKFNYADYYTQSVKGSNKVIVYDATKGYKNCKEYTVEVSVGDKWTAVPVYYAEVTRRNMDVMRTYFASVDLNGSMKVKVTPLEKFEKYEVKPKVDVPSATASGNTVEFTVNGPMNLSVEFDGNIMNNLQLFVNPLETDIPDINDPNVIFVTPGIHTIDTDSYITNTDNTTPTVKLASGQTLYLAGGAVLQATVIPSTKAKNIKIKGRGIIDILPYNTPSGSLEDTRNLNGGKCPCGIKLQNTNNVEIDGVILRNPAYYCIYGGTANNTKINNVKMFSRGECNDGIDFMAAHDVTVTNCYIRANDDNIGIYPSHWNNVGSTYNWTVKNCVILADCAHAVNIGTAGSADPDCRDEIYNINISDVDILDVFENSKTYWGAIALTIGNENIVHDINVSDVRMYKLSKSKPFHICVQLNKAFNTAPGYRISNVTFKNITLYGDSYNKSKISGYSDERYVKGVTFENLKIGNVKVTNSNKGNYFEIGNYASDITFK